MRCRGLPRIPCVFALAFMVLLWTGVGARAQEAVTSADRASLVPLLGFEGENLGSWIAQPPETVFLDRQAVRTGQGAVRLERGAASALPFTSLTKLLPVDFRGTQVELRGFIRTEDVSGFAGLWMKQEGESPIQAFVSMEKQAIRGTTDWTEYAVTLPLHGDAQHLYFGFMLQGTGRAWADDLQLLVDGKPVWEAPRAGYVPSVLDRDHEFDGGSKVRLSGLTPGQVGNLARLGRVWGFLKYHHPAVTSGQRHWDYELFRIMPSILAAEDGPAANAVLLRWIDGLGEIKGADRPAAAATDEPHLRPDHRWLEDETVLGSELAGRLRAIRQGSNPIGGQFYVSLTPGVKNPVFAREPAYAMIANPDAGYQLLGLFRFWNIIRYWFPYRDLVDGDWDAVLEEFIPRIGLAQDRDGYQRELMALIARVSDTHANLWSSSQVRPPTGDGLLPLAVRFIAGQAVVVQLIGPAEQRPPELRVGDVITAIDGHPVTDLVKAWSPYYAASNEPTRLRDIARSFTRGPVGEVQLAVQRDGQTLDVTARRLPSASLAKLMPRTHDLPGETFRLLSPDVAYLKLSSVRQEEAKSYVERAAGTKGLVIDLRNYPSAFMVFSLGSLLVDRPVEFVRFTKADLAEPGAFRFGPALGLQPQGPHYAGSVMILVDEVTQSSAEYTTMALRTAPRAKVIGSTTAGADGNVSRIPLPGGLHSMISGIGVFYPDKRPTQRVGIVPDIEVRPTLEGIRAGRDEVLEAALRQILGPEAPDDEIRRLAKPAGT